MSDMCACGTTLDSPPPGVESWQPIFDEPPRPRVRTVARWTEDPMLRRAVRIPSGYIRYQIYRFTACVIGDGITGQERRLLGSRDRKCPAPTCGSSWPRAAYQAAVLVPPKESGREVGPKQVVRHRLIEASVPESHQAASMRLPWGHAACGPG